ncbi:hypothetical protein [Actinomadura violacea]|uniref:Uncharacterized protein n=1 Tax=Actinomadura violacea TaxID=2819934 RepID=A0ABS3RY54_9ACTN|nr:hypothetical protein [Actinomadura violacea]MBO2461696.1 hypothetical protein [Actinomadura violacea]
MFTVTGLMEDGVGYQIDVGGPKPAFGVVSGSDNVLDLLASSAETQVQASPTSAAAPLDTGDPASVLSALFMLTTVATVTGDDVPDVFDATDEDGNPPPDGAVF